MWIPLRYVPARAPIDIWLAIIPVAVGRNDRHMALGADRHPRPISQRQQAGLLRSLRPARTYAGRGELILRAAVPATEPLARDG